MRFLSYLVSLVALTPVGAQVRINEVMASNTRTYADITDFEDYPDWIELHNPDASAAAIGGAFLSDNPARPYKWRIPQNAVIPAGGYLLIMADGNDAAVGETHRRDYWPFSNFTTEKYHSSFSLSASGESVVLTSVAGASNTDLIELGSTWSFLDDGSAQTTQWRGRTFDDSTWASGPAPLGYGDEEVTEISYGGDDDDRFITSYFRQGFEVPDPAAFDSLLLSLQVDDAAAIYLNGNEIVRRNLPSGELNYRTRALESTAPPEEADFNGYTLSPEFLVAGTNVLAVEVHQIAPSSVDMRLDLSLKGAAFTGATTEDSVTYTQQITDVPLARSPIDPTQWVSLDRGTPGAANAGNEVSDLRATSGLVGISPAGGLYADPQNVTLTSSAGEIRYTLDGTEPESNDTLFTGAIMIDAPTVVRARVFESGKVPGQIVTQTFLIGEEFNGMPVLSITAEPEALFGDEIGIYLNQHEPDVGIGPAIYKGKDAPGHLEFFPNDGSEGFAVNGGLRMGGENNWAGHLQRAFNFVTRGKYGDDELKYNLFPGSNIPIFTALTIREGGDDYGAARLTDAIFDPISEDKLEVETNKLQAATVFINGEYWGHYNIRDRWDDNWFFQHYGVNTEEYDHLRFENTGATPNIENGSLDEWLDFYDFIQSNDLNDPAIWQFVESRIDLESFMDFVVVESWANNSSWTGNREVWKAHRAGAKWRWFIPDMDRTFRSDGTLGGMISREQTLRHLVQSDRFRGLLAQRFAAHLASTFTSDRIHSIIDEFGAIPQHEMDRTSARWGGAPSESSYLSSLESMKSYATSREEGLLSEVSSDLGQDPPILLTLATTGAGSFRIQGVEVPEGQLSAFPNIETQIEALPAPGYRFDCWVGIEGPQETTFNLSQSGGIIAKFVSTGASTLGGTLLADMTLSADTNYVVEQDLIIPTGVTLTVAPGVTLEVARHQDIRVMGTLVVNGEEGREITIQGRFGDTWGGLSFENPTTTSALSHLVIRDATRGNDPVIYPSAISGLNATLDLEFLDIGASRGPLFFRGGSLSLRDSTIDIPITGDAINVKQGAAETIRCTFTGNGAPDTDAIDYDGVINGVIRDCRIYNFRGFNSDGIDTGEQCVNVLLEGNVLFFNSDKGVSVGQGSTVVMRKNLIVGSLQGVGVKDDGSSILIDQNTFVDCAEAVAVFEKNFGSGGGSAEITNCIFSGCNEPVTVDQFSNATISYSLSNTLTLPGATNLVGSPLFIDPLSFNYGLQAGSPAIDSGDPVHEMDPDGSRADMGALYVFSPDDYPFTNGTTVVINEVLANSGEGTDWIELHNRTSEAIDIGGWFLSDDGSALLKYRIPLGTTIPAKGFLIFYEDTNFGVDSLDPNRLTGFALSDTGETLHLTSATDDQISGYLFKEDYGPSFEDESIGYYFKPSSDSYNFITQVSPTQAAPNSGPKVGPIVISEIMYAPSGNGAAEYLELLNISSEAVVLFDNLRDRAWRLSNGIELEFPAISPISLNPGQRLILTRSTDAFTAEFTPEPGTQVLEWLTGKLSNGGETVQLDRPGPLDDSGNVSYVRVDRVNYDNDAPWDIGADETGLSLTKIIENEYGNDFTNWAAGSPTPGGFAIGDSFADWALAAGVSDPNADPDGDGRSNLFEYAFDSDPMTPNNFDLLSLEIFGGNVTAAYDSSILKPDLNVNLESSVDLEQWAIKPTQAGADVREAKLAQELKAFFRLRISQKP
ncbi:lamin tail domain-containing protein [Akkermansiaceae bacterium]|nr:lamin tail domain-containing protein [Akkermansiaceae bacterium]